MDKAAAKINGLYSAIDIDGEIALRNAMLIGEVLFALQESHDKPLNKWIKENIKIARGTAYRYIELFKHREELHGINSISQAYRVIKEKKEYAKKAQWERINEYLDTGDKPSDWIDGVDDILAQGEKFYRELKNKQAEREEAERKAYQERIQQQLDELTQKTAKNSHWKEKLKLTENDYEPFSTAIGEYLETLDCDNRRLECCHLFLKAFKKAGAAIEHSISSN
ncbi:hypothetical protein FACS1894200_03560 [Spirochaetia bacterium]|nr:hypothetical protein FACS1894200_03560 [Spirochaetia bacterium]